MPLVELWVAAGMRPVGGQSVAPCTRSDQPPAASVVVRRRAAHARLEDLEAGHVLEIIEGKAQLFTAARQHGEVEG